MSKTLINFWLDTSLLLLLATLIFVSVVVYHVFPPGPDAAGWRLWGYGYSQWCGFQFSVLALLVLAVLLHVMLHWSWVCGVIFAHLLPGSGRRKGKLNDGTRTLLGVGLLIVLVNVLGLAIAAAVLMIQSPASF